uniref:Cytochrome c biogenesis protein CcsB n=1 Tax=Neogoniolithon spectabile TaxID=231755 RepID=A0A3G3MH65_9FLOR|nr:c-type cytochrome biogenensis protein [Neogoniolithon spectabile]AYR06142.1 c-type cytochrome biogenensis protein [Neogoniolithon spectabile]
MIKTRLYWIIIKKLCNLNFSIGLLLCIAVFSMFGTFIEQDQPIAYYQANYPLQPAKFTFLNWQIIDYLGINHVYSNRIFFGPSGCVFLYSNSLYFHNPVTLVKVLQAVEVFFMRVNFYKKKDHYSHSQYISLINWISLLILKKYHVFHKGKAVYGYKGLLGRISPIFVHFSLILTLVGPLLGTSTGFSLQEVVPSGEFFHFQNFITAGNFSKTLERIIIKADDFFVTYNEDRSIEQFFAKLFLFNDDYEKILDQIVSVNHPIKYRGLTIYQTDWQINALRICLGPNRIIEKTLQSSSVRDTKQGIWLCQLSLGREQKVVIVISTFDGFLSIYDDRGNLIIKTRYGQWNVVHGVPLLVKEVMFSTGLQIKVDPGIPVVYTGFGILMFNVVLSYISYSQIWVSINSCDLHVGGQTNRAYLLFEDELEQILSKYILLSGTID